MSETSTSLAQLAQANEALRAQRYVEAVQRYEAVLQQAPALAEVTPPSTCRCAFDPAASSRARARSIFLRVVSMKL